MKLQRVFFCGVGGSLSAGFIAQSKKKKNARTVDFIPNDSHTLVRIPLLILLTKGHKILGGRKNTDVAFNACNVEAK